MLRGVDLFLRRVAKPRAVGKSIVITFLPGDTLAIVDVASVTSTPADD